MHDLLVFRVRSLDRDNPKVYVEICSTACRWPDILEDFLKGLQAIGFALNRESLEKGFQEILEEWI